MTRTAGITAPCLTEALVNLLLERYDDLVILYKDESGHPVDPSCMPGRGMVACNYEYVSRSLVITVRAESAR